MSPLLLLEPDAGERLELSTSRRSLETLELVYLGAVMGVDHC